MLDQTIKADAGKPRLSLVPTEIITDIARVREYGVQKYGKVNSWKEVEKERYKDAAYRHFLAYLENEESRDDESGLPHLWHLACNIAFLCSLKEKTDDTMPKTALPQVIERQEEPKTEEFDWKAMKEKMKEKSEQKIDIPELDCKITDSDLFKEFMEYKNAKARKEIKQ